MSVFRRIRSSPVLMMAAGGAFCFGAYVATIGPYQSLIAQQVFGLSESAYAAVLVGALLMGVTVAVGIGIVTDQRPSRRRMAIVATWGLIGGGLLVAILPSATAFVLAHVLLLPLAGTVFGQVFAVARLASQTWPRAERDAVLGVLRAIFAVPFVVVLPVWSWAADHGLPLLALYLGLAVVGLVQLVLFQRAWPADGSAPWVEVKSGLGFRAALAEMLVAPVFVRVLLFGAMSAGGALAGILIGLVFAEAGRSNGEVGLFFALFVAIEVGATLLIGPLQRLAGRATLIFTGVVVYALFVALLPFVAGGPLVWLLILPAGLGGALQYTLSIAYLQDLLGARAGAGASLLALQRIATDLVSAGSFWLGTLIAGYGLAALIGTGVTLAALASLVILDRAGRSREGI